MAIVDATFGFSDKAGLGRKEKRVDCQTKSGREGRDFGICLPKKRCQIRPAGRLLALVSARIRASKCAFWRRKPQLSVPIVIVCLAPMCRLTTGVSSVETPKGWGTSHDARLRGAASKAAESDKPKSLEGAGPYSHE